MTKEDVDYIILRLKKDNHVGTHLLNELEIKLPSLIEEKEEIIPDTNVENINTIIYRDDNFFFEMFIDDMTKNYPYLHLDYADVKFLFNDLKKKNIIGAIKRLRTELHLYYSVDECKNMVQYIIKKYIF